MPMYLLTSLLQILMILLKNLIFEPYLKMQPWHLYLKKLTETLRITIYQLAYSRIYLKSLRDIYAFFVNYPILWISFCQHTNALFAKVTAHNSVYGLRLKNVSEQLINKNFSLRYCLRHLTVFLASFCLQNIIPTDLSLRH